MAAKAPGAQDAGRIASRGIASPSSMIPHKAEMEQAFEQDFSHVRAHTDAKAHNASIELGAEAYTLGNDIAFSDSAPDKGIVAHELAHIVQHGTSSGAQASETTSKNAPTEREAKAAQQAIANGRELPSISETLPFSSIAGYWHIQDNRNNYWELDYSQGETAADDRITASFISQRVVTQEGEENFITDVTPAPLEINVLLSRSGLPPGSLIENPQEPGGGDQIHYIINPRLRPDMQGTVRSELGYLQGRRTLVRADIEPAPEITGPPMSPEERTAPLAGEGREASSEIPSTMRRGHRVREYGGGAPSAGHVYVYNSLGVLAARLNEIPNRGYSWNRRYLTGRPSLWSGGRREIPDFRAPLMNIRQTIPSNCIYLVYALSDIEVGLMAPGQLGETMTLTPEEGSTTPPVSGARAEARSRVAGGVGLAMDLFNALGVAAGRQMQIAVVVYQPAEGSPFHVVYYHQAGSWNLHSPDWILRELGETEEQTAE
ncbi:MAG: DUF4157 domain-containing protein [Anaerolineales bacterium]|nr:DUF4157 domain-containing protein [Anaerolineales bacterium]